MALHAGFAAALSVEKKSAQRILHAAYVNNLIPPRMIGKAKVPGAFGIKFPFLLDYDFFLAEPELVLEPNAQNLARLKCEIFGTVVCSALGQPTLTTQIFSQVTFGMPLIRIFDEAKKILQFGLNPKAALITDFDCKIESGDDPKEVYGFNLSGKGSQLQQAIFLSITGLASSSLLVTFPVLSEFVDMGAIFTDPKVNITKDSLNIGLDIEGLTAGDEDALVDLNLTSTDRGWKKTYQEAILTGSDEYGEPIYDTGWTPTTKTAPGPHWTSLAIAINSVALNELFTKRGRYLIIKGFEQTKCDQIMASVEGLKNNKKDSYEASATARTVLNKLSLSYGNDYAEVGGQATHYAEAALHASFTLKFRIVRTSVDGSTNFVNVQQGKVGLTGEVYDVNIETPEEVSMMEALIGAGALLLAPATSGISLVVGVIVEVVIFSAVSVELGNQERALGGKVTGPLGQFLGSTRLKFALPGTAGPTFTLQPVDMVLKESGATAWVGLTSESSAFLYVRTPVSNFEKKKKKIPKAVVQAGDKRPLIVVFEDKQEVYNPKDPAVRIRWSVYGETTANLLIETDTLISGDGISNPKEIIIPHASKELMPYDLFVVSCRVYRPWADGTVKELFQSNIHLELTDLLLRKQPYVKWKHEVFYEGYSAKKKDPSRHRTEWVRSDRESKIHKTNPLERCLFADQYSRDLRKEELNYLEKLPFDPSEIKKYQHLVCPYCFFPKPNMKVDVETLNLGDTPV